MVKHKWQSDSIMKSIDIFLTHGIIFQQFNENQIGANLWFNSVWFSMPLPMRNLIARLALSLSLSLKDIFVYSAHSRTPLWLQKVLHFFWYGPGSPAAHRQKKYERANLIYIHVSQCFWVLYGHFEKEILPVGTGLPWSIFPNLPEVFFQISLDYFYESSRVFFWISWSVFPNR